MLNGKMFMNYETWREEIMPYFKIFSECLCGATEKKNTNTL
jgi:hypothetical protein